MSTTAATRQKQHERFLLERFIEAAELQVEIEEEREGPDFLVRFEGRLVGIEVTQLFIKPDQKSKENLELVEIDSDSANIAPLQVQESISRKMVARARELYQKTDAPPAGVSLCFGLGYDLRALERERTASALASFIQSLNLAPGQSFDWRREENDGPVPREISFIHALGVPNHRLAHWAVARAGWVVPLDENALRARIDEKAKRLPDYHSVVPENWLLIVADRTNPSQMFDRGNALNARSVTSPFSRSFFYGYPEKFVIELGALAK